MNTTKTVVLFASPQCLVDKDDWREMIKVLLLNKLLRLIAVDELQLFVQYGASGFRQQFAMLSTTIFKDVKTW